MTRLASVMRLAKHSMIVAWTFIHGKTRVKNNETLTVVKAQMNLELEIEIMKFVVTNL